MDVNDALTVFWVVLAVSAVTIGRWAVKRRNRPQKWHEPPRRTYNRPPDELDDVRRREHRRPM